MSEAGRSAWLAGAWQAAQPTRVAVGHRADRGTDGRRPGATQRLPIDQDLLVCRHLPALQSSTNRVPRDEIANGVAVVQRVDQIANLDAVPYERALKLRDRDLFTLDRS